MALLDRLSQRGIQRLGRTVSPGKQPGTLGLPTQQPIGGLPTQTAGAGMSLPKPLTTAPTAPRPLTTAPTADRLGQRPQRGTLASTFQGGAVKKRFIADLPANMQLQGIQQILAGQDTNNPQLNDFVKGQAAQGKQPEEIRQAFIAEQKVSPNPLVIL